MRRSLAIAIGLLGATLLAPAPAFADHGASRFVPLHAATAARVPFPAMRHIHRFQHFGSEGRNGFFNGICCFAPDYAVGGTTVVIIPAAAPSPPAPLPAAAPRPASTPPTVEVTPQGVTIVRGPSIAPGS